MPGPVDIYDMAQTWNDAATTFDGIKLDVTDTASAADSRLLDLLVGGSSKLRLTKSGRLGIGEASPDGLLHIKGAGYVYSYLESTGSGGTIDRYVTDSAEFAWWTKGLGTNAICLYDYTAGAERIIINGSGYVGIGPTSPTHPLDVDGAAVAAVARFRGTGSLYTLTETTGTGSARAWFKRNGILIGSIGSSSAGVFSMASGNGDSSHLTIVAGKVGIGTAAPNRALTVGTTGQVSLGSLATDDTTAGMYWHSSSDNYCFRRTAGPWSAPDYQQIELNWPTGIILNPGASNARSFVDVQGAMRVSANVDFTNLPTSDPSVAGRLWNDGGTLKVSA